VEARDRWRDADRRKMRLVRQQHPDLRIVMVFQNLSRTISKRSKTTYEEYSRRIGLEVVTPDDLGRLSRGWPELAGRTYTWPKSCERPEYFGLVFFQSYIASFLMGAILASVSRKLIGTFLASLNKPGYTETVTALATWVLIGIYVKIGIIDYRPLTEVSEGHLIWPVAVSVAICVLGLPLLIPRVIRNTAAALRDGGVQWIVGLLIATATYCAFTFAQGLADFMIRGMVQTNPDQLPSAQRALTAWYAMFGWITILYLASMVSLFAARARCLPVAGAVAGLIALYIVVPNGVLALATAIPSDEQTRRPGLEDIGETLILWSSFVPNFLVEQVVQDGSGQVEQRGKRFCSNLPDDVWVSPASPDEVIPDKVIVAEWRERTQGDRGQRYRYRLTACENSNNPEAVK
jgi:hypothetical protein